MTESNVVYINELKDHVGQEVTLHGWLYNSRASGKILFLIIRDGTGLCQCIVEKGKVPERSSSKLKRLGQESSLSVTGPIRADERSVGGFEMAVTEPKSSRRRRLSDHAQASRRRIPDEAPPSAPAVTEAVGHRQGSPHGDRRDPPVLQRQRLHPRRYAHLHDDRRRGPDVAVRGGLFRPAAAPDADGPTLPRIGRDGLRPGLLLRPTFRAERARPAGT